MWALRSVLYGALAVAALGAAALVYVARDTRGEIDALEARVIARAEALGPVSAAAYQGAPAPVSRYFRYVFPDGPPEGARYAEIEMAGAFRRPLTEGFQPTSARQIASLRRAEMVFSADTRMAGPIWAIAWDAYVDGEMTMEARLLSAVTVMRQSGSERLDRISLRRWLLESPLYPMALLPGGVVRWEAIDDRHARAVAQVGGLEADLIATFDAAGALVSFRAPEPGDLTTPYHGSGEHVARSDYQLIEGARVPMAFEISRVGADGRERPFWKGRVTRLHFAR